MSAIATALPAAHRDASILMFQRHEQPASPCRSSSRNSPSSQIPEFYITGESYAGVYVPTLVKEILDNAPEINIKGMAVGDPCTDNQAQKFHGHDMVRTQERFRCRGNVRFIVEQVRRPSPSEIDDGGAGSHDHNACVEEHDDESDIERMHCCPAEVFDLN